MGNENKGAPPTKGGAPALLSVRPPREWTVHALNVRTSHVHVVVSAADAPERVMNAFKSWSRRRMVEAGTLASGTKAWVRHGTTRYLSKIKALAAACRYVSEGQGDELSRGESVAH